MLVGAMLVREVVNKRLVLMLLHKNGTQQNKENKQRTIAGMIQILDLNNGYLKGAKNCEVTKIKKWDK